MSLVAWLRRFFHGRDKFAPRAPTQCHLWHIKAIGAQDIAGAFALVEGLFDDARKRPLPRFPRLIGLVTGNDAAAKRDVLTHIAQRFPPANVLVAEDRKSVV